MNPYEILELQPGATSDEIKAAYHRLAKQWHPDRFPAGPAKEEAENRFRQLSEAFVMLKDVNRRTEIDATLATAPQAPTAPVSEAAPLKDPRTKGAEDWFKDAQKSMEYQDLDKALGLVQYAIRLDAGKPEYHLLLAEVLGARSGDKRTMVKALETAHQLSPKDVDTMVRLSELYRSLGMSARADGLIERARSISPKHKALKGLTPARPAAPSPEPQAKQEPESSLSSALRRIGTSLGLFSKRS